MKSGVANHEEVLQDIGRRIRALRLARGLTLQQAAERAGITPSLLSQVERCRANPSLGSLIAIASAVGAPMTALFADIDPPPAVSPVVRWHERRILHTPQGVDHAQLTASEERDISFAENVYPPGSASSERPMSHEGREYGLILQGTLLVQIGHCEYVLEPGDSITIDSTIPHRLVNTGSVPVHMVSVHVRQR